MPAQAQSREACIRDIYVRQCRVMEARYPALRELGRSPTAENPTEIFEDYCWHVRRIDPAAANLDRIDIHEDMLPRMSAPALRDRLLPDLLALQTARGLAAKVSPFLQAGDNPRYKETIDALWAEHTRNYGFDTRRLRGTSINRGNCLRFYFSQNPSVLKGKRVLHFAPELPIRTWMREAADRIGFIYAAADGFIPGMDHYVDLCDIALDDAQFDVVIIHRVLEHVIDDSTALTELHRILAPGGILNISVPEVLYLPDTADWRVPDPKDHQHFRVYGRNFASMLETAGFEPNRCDWMFEQAPEKLAKANAYPLRFYNALKR
jgi:SAM-dependent methyltransferase